MTKEAKEKRIEVLDYALNCIANREDRQNYFSILQDMFMELQEELYGTLGTAPGVVRLAARIFVTWEDVMELLGCRKSK